MSWHVLSLRLEVTDETVKIAFGRKAFDGCIFDFDILRSFPMFLSNFEDPQAKGIHCHERCRASTFTIGILTNLSCFCPKITKSCESFFRECFYLLENQRRWRWRPSSGTCFENVGSLKIIAMHLFTISWNKWITLISNLQLNIFMEVNKTVDLNLQKLIFYQYLENC